MTLILYFTFNVVIKSLDILHGFFNAYSTFRIDKALPGCPRNYFN